MNSSILYTNFIQYLPPQANRKRQKEEKTLLILNKIPNSLSDLENQTFLIF